MFLLWTDIPLKEIKLTMAHECRHISDLRYYKPPLIDEDKKAWDRRAKDFAQRTMSELN